MQLSMAPALRRARTTRFVQSTLPALGLALAALTDGGRADACCTVKAASDEPVAIADQEVLILWDEARQEQHFVRRATFQPERGESFGFLVPTPSQPTLAETSSAVFARLQDITRPVPRPVWVPDLTPLLLGGFTTFGVEVSPKVERQAGVVEDDVRVLEQRRVAGYDVAVLEADDPEALARWLRDNGYDARPQIAEWARPYIAEGWKITAFAYAQDAAATTEVAAGTVRLSFGTPRPLFPYRVPSDVVARPGEGHRLRVYFASTTQFEGTFGERDAWSAEVPFSAALRSDLAGWIDVPTASPPRWLTVFEDHGWPGGHDDVWFQPAEHEDTVIPTYLVADYFPLPADALLLGGWGIRKLLRRRRARREAEATPDR